MAAGETAPDAREPGASAAEAHSLAVRCRPRPTAGNNSLAAAVAANAATAAWWVASADRPTPAAKAATSTRIARSDCSATCPKSPVLAPCTRRRIARLSHLLGGVYANNRQTRSQNLCIGADQSEACGGQFPVMSLYEAQMWRF